MKKFYENLKDTLYASMDYIIMLGIIVLVVLVIGWRLDILFQKDILAIVAKEEIKTEESLEPEDEDEELDKKAHSEDGIIKDAIVGEENESEEEIIPEDGKNPPIEEHEEIIIEKVKNIEVKIPAGSFPAQIGSILESRGLIASSKDFIEKAVDLNLDTKLQSGTFSIPENSSMENIVKIIAKQKT